MLVPSKTVQKCAVKTEKSTSIHLNSKKICSLLVFRLAEMVPWYWYLQIYQQFLWVPMWVLGFYWTKEEGRSHIFLVISAFYELFLTVGWCPEGDSNSHASWHYHLKIACLPIPPSGHRCLSIKRGRVGKLFFCRFSTPAPSISPCAVRMTP